jgi:hypothetical protein
MIEEDTTDEFVYNALGLIGDIGTNFGAAAKESLMTDWVSDAISQGRARHSSKRTRTHAAYAQKVNRHSGCANVRPFANCLNKPLSRLRLASFSVFLSTLHLSCLIANNIEAALCHPRMATSLITLHKFSICPIPCFVSPTSQYHI